MKCLFFPPRATSKIPTDNLPAYDGREDFVAQAKFNGSYCVARINPDGSVTTWNRHRERMKCDLDLSVLAGSSVRTICGELMNKSQADERGDKPYWFVAHDIIEDGSYLNGLPYLQRLSKLERVFAHGQRSDRDYLAMEFGNVKLARTFRDNFCQHFNELSSIPMIEGLVLKRIDVALRYGFRPDSNSGWSIKVRKPSANYMF